MQPQEAMPRLGPLSAAYVLITAMFGRYRQNRQSPSFRENLDIMKRLWTEDKVTLDGRFSHLESIPMQPKPVQKPCPPIWFGGHAEAALRRAVELGDSYMGAGSTPMEAFLEDIKQLPADLTAQAATRSFVRGSGSQPEYDKLK